MGGANRKWRMAWCVNRISMIPWDDLQRIKNELAGEDRTAIEVFPTVSDLVDKAPMRHLWVLPSGYALPFGLHRQESWGKAR